MQKPLEHSHKTTYDLTVNALRHSFISFVLLFDKYVCCDCCLLLQFDLTVVLFLVWSVFWNQVCEKRAHSWRVWFLSTSSLTNSSFSFQMPHSYGTALKCLIPGATSPFECGRNCCEELIRKTEAVIPLSYRRTNSQV